jgi:hypothetical protein
MFDRLTSFWVYGGALSAVLILLLSPLLLAHWSVPLAVTFLHLPAYMIHQYEEHDGDRFRLFFNKTIGEGYDVLSPLAVFITNVPGVWGIVTISILGASEINLGWSYLAVYLVLVNAFVHIVHAISFHRYNPGLATAILLFLPLGGLALWLLQRAGVGSLGYHAFGLGIAVLIHAAILLHVRRKLAAYRRHSLLATK